MMIQTRVVPAADFASLATGYGDADVVARLRAGRYDRNRLLLRALLEGAPPEATALRAGYDLLARVERRAPDVVREAVLYPHVSAWIAQAARRLRRGSDIVELGYLAAVAAAAALTAAVDFEIDVPLRDGDLVLPGVGRARVPGGRAVVTVRGTAGAFTVDGAPAADWRPLHRLRAGGTSLMFAVGLDDLDWYRDCHRMGATERIDAGQVALWRKCLDEAWAVLVRDHRQHAEAIAAGLTTLVPLRADLTNRGVTATSMDAYGAMALSLPTDAMALAVGLVHEFQHAKLGALMDLVPLHEAADDERYYAPWRDDARPLGGLFHGAYAFLGVADFWRIRRRHDDEHRRFAEFEFARWRERVSRVIDVLARTGRLTEAGQRFLAGMRSTVDSWWTEQVAAEAAELARRAAEDHRIAWRVRNLACDQEAVRTLAAAWVSGVDNPPQVTVPVRTEGSPRVFRQAARLHLIARRLTEPGAVAEAEPVLDASAADHAYAAGELAEAVAGYRRLVTDEPGCAEHWAGLALALAGHEPGPAAAALGTAPEVVAAAHAAIGGGADPVALAAWLAPLLTGSAARSR